MSQGAYFKLPRLYAADRKANIVQMPFFNRNLIRTLAEVHREIAYVIVYKLNFCSSSDAYKLS